MRHVIKDAIVIHHVSIKPNFLIYVVGVPLLCDML